MQVMSECQKFGGAAADILDSDCSRRGGGGGGGGGGGVQL